MQELFFQKLGYFIFLCNLAPQNIKLVKTG